MLRVHLFDVPDRGLGVGTIVMQAQIIGRLAANTVQEVGDPGLTSRVAGAGRADEFIPTLIARPQGLDLVEPELGGLFGRDSRAFGLIEVVDDVLIGGLDAVPVVAGEFGQVVDHRAEGGAVVEFGRGPGVPVADGGDGAAEGDFGHGPGDALVAGAVGVGPVP